MLESSSVQMHPYDASKVVLANQRALDKHLNRSENAPRQYSPQDLVDFAESLPDGKLKEAAQVVDKWFDKIDGARSFKKDGLLEAQELLGFAALGVSMGSTMQVVARNFFRFEDPEKVGKHDRKFDLEAVKKVMNDETVEPDVRTVAWSLAEGKNGNFERLCNEAPSSTYRDGEVSLEDVQYYYHNQDYREISGNYSADLPKPK